MPLRHWFSCSNSIQARIGHRRPRLAGIAAEVLEERVVLAAPVANGDAVTTTEDAVYSGNVLINNGSGADTDPDGDVLTVDVLTVIEVNGVAASVGKEITLASGAKLTVNANGNFTYDPRGKFDSLAPGQSSTDGFTYKISDGHGGDASASVTVTVTGVNDPPVAPGATVSTDAPLPVDGRINATDVDGGTLSYAIGTQGTKGTAVVRPDGTFTYTPNSSAGGTDSFTIVVSDGRSGTATATVSATLLANAAPVGTPDVFRVREDATATGNLITNDTDANHDTLAVSAVNGAAADVGKSIVLASGAKIKVDANGAYSYDPNGAFAHLLPGEVATDTFTYTVSDGRGGTSTATVTARVYGAGTTDVVAYNAGEWWVGVSNGSKFQSSKWATWNDVAWDALRQADVNGDGRTDVLGLIDGVWWVGVSDGSKFVTQQGPVWADADWRDIAVRDLNGDGKADLLARVGGEWWASLGTGTGFSAATRWGTWADTDWDVVFVDDADGDGRNDLIGLRSGQWWVGLSDGSKFKTATQWGQWSDTTWDALGTIDANGDGKADLYAFKDRTWYLAKSTGTSFTLGVRASWATGTWKDARVADLDGDGRGDLVARLNGQWWAGLSDSSGGEASRSSWGDWSEGEWQGVRAGDFNGDGRTDLTGRLDGDWYVGTSDGAKLTTSRWGSWAATGWQAEEASGFGALSLAPQPQSTLSDSGSPNSETASLVSPPSSDAAQTTSAAATAVAPPTNDEQLAALWAGSDRDKELTDGLLAI